MLFILFNFLQSQARLSKVVIVTAALVLIAGVSLFVYFYRRYKRIEREPEEDWELSRSSLFANVAAPSQKTEEAGSSASEASATVPEKAPAETHATLEFASEIAQEPPASAGTTKSPRVEATPPQEPAAPEPRLEPAEHRLTEMLASPSPKEIVAEPEAEPTTFDEEVWAHLEAGEQPPIAHEHLAEASSQAFETTRDARVEQRSHREPFEPPRIEPLTPREQEAVTREMRSPRIPENRQNKDTALFGSAPTSRAGRETRELAAEPAAVTSARMPEPFVAGKSLHVRAGSILGLPAETSHKPLILGQPVRPVSETGIGALSNYGKDTDKTSGHAGTIALLIVLTLLGGAVAVYFFVPSIHARVNTFVARVRGVDARAALEAKTRAQVIPSYRPEVNKNMVTARGAVDNISDEPLEDLLIEVSLQRGGDAPPEIRQIPVNPNPLPPNQRGSFQFEYDGKRDTGFTGYKITRLLSNGTEVKFRAPPK